MTDVTVNWLKETDSTNSDAHRHRHEASDFTVWAAEFQTAGTVFGLKVLCVLVPALFVLGSWAAFKFVWNITPEKKAAMAAMKAAQNTETPAEADAE